MTTRRSVVALVLMITAQALAFGPASDATVACDVIVTGVDGVPVADLSQSDIEVLSDGVLVPVSSFSLAAPEVSAVLVVDTTMSQPLRRYEIQNAVAINWAQSLIPRDRARVGVIGSKTLIGPWLSIDRAADMPTVRTMIGRAELEPSPLWDAVDMAVHALAKAPGSKAVLLLTDGRATANRLGLDEVARIAVRANVSVSSVSEGGERVLPQSGDAATRVRSDASLQWLADATGGIYLQDGVARRTLRPQPDPFAYVRELAQTPNRPGPLLARIMTTLRQRYRLVFTAAADGGMHTLEVRVRRPGVVVRVKRSYVAIGEVKPANADRQAVR